MIRMKELTGNLKIWKHEATTYAVAIIYIFSAIALVLFVIALILLCLCKTSLIFWATYIGSCIAIANAILLYATLNSQKESLANEKKAHKQERFEITFFNLLESQRKLTEEISIVCDSINENAGVSWQRINGRFFFAYANKELQLIRESLDSKIDKKYFERDTLDSIQAFENEWKEKDSEYVKGKQKQEKWDSLLRDTRIEYCNLVYDINENDRQRYRSYEDTPYTLFKKRWYGCFEHYIRNLYYILLYVNEEKHLDEKAKQKYITFIQSQMSRNELIFMETHGKSFQRFQELLDKTHLTDITTNNKL